jgi:hypothetical protein
VATVPSRVLDALSALEPEGDSDTKIAKVVEEALVRRLHHYQYVDRQMQRKYGITFDEFTDRRIVDQRGNSFEAESDFWEWELAVDGIHTMERRLNELRQPPDDHR